MTKTEDVALHGPFMWKLRVGEAILVQESSIINVPHNKFMVNKRESLEHFVNLGTLKRGRD